MDQTFRVQAFRHTDEMHMSVVKTSLSESTVLLLSHYGQYPTGWDAVFTVTDLFGSVTDKTQLRFQSWDELVTHCRPWLETIFGNALETELYLLALEEVRRRTEASSPWQTVDVSYIDPAFVTYESWSDQAHQPAPMPSYEDLILLATS